MARHDDGRWPHSVYSHGAEPDPRFSLANERTFLAWIRTTLALLAAAAAIHAFDLNINEHLSQALSAGFALAGLGCAIHAWRNWARAERALRENKPLPSNAAGIALTLIACVGALALIVAGFSA